MQGVYEITTLGFKGIVHPWVDPIDLHYMNGLT